MNEILARLNTGAHYLNIVLFNFIFVFAFVIDMNTFFRFIIWMISLFFILAGIRGLNDTKYKIFDVTKIFGE